MAKVAVKVLPGHRLYEEGATRVDGDIFFLDEDRVKDYAGQVEIITGVKMDARNTMIAAPEPIVPPGAMPSPVTTRLTEPRKSGKSKTK